MRCGRITVTPGFLLLAAWLNYVDHQGILPGVVFSCVLHELGHIAALHIQHISVREIRLTTAGAEICVRGNMSYAGELAAALAGPLTNLLLAMIFCRISHGTALAGINLVLGFFNLLPLGDLDGGRMLRCFLALTAGPERGEGLMLLFSELAVCILGAAGCCLLILGGNPTLLLVTGWLYLTVSHLRIKRKK